VWFLWKVVDAVGGMRWTVVYLTSVERARGVLVGRLFEFGGAWLEESLFAKHIHLDLLKAWFCYCCVREECQNAICKKVNQNNSGFCVCFVICARAAIKRWPNRLESLSWPMDTPHPQKCEQTASSASCDAGTHGMHARANDETYTKSAVVLIYFFANCILAFLSNAAIAKPSF
jgi:hypothetical protein